jgi:hypothetical protein
LAIAGGSSGSGVFVEAGGKTYLLGLVEALYPSGFVDASDVRDSIAWLASIHDEHADDRRASGAVFTPPGFSTH